MTPMPAANYGKSGKKRHVPNLLENPPVQGEVLECLAGYVLG